MMGESRGIATCWVFAFDNVLGFVFGTCFTLGI